MTVRPISALSSLLVNAVLGAALLAGLTTPSTARAESASITLLAADRAATAQTDYAGLYLRAVAMIHRAWQAGVRAGAGHLDPRVAPDVPTSATLDVNARGVSAYDRHDAVLARSAAR